MLGPVPACVNLLGAAVLLVLHPYVRMLTIEETQVGISPPSPGIFRTRDWAQHLQT